MGAAVDKPWADGPLKLIATPKSRLNGKSDSDASRVATEMCNVHNCLIRALNCILLQARNVSSGTAVDITDFVTFCLAVTLIINEHHHTEETLMFPLFEQHSKSGLLNENIVQHEEFHHGLHDLNIYLAQVKNGVAMYDGEKVTRLVEGFAPALTRHLQDEIPTLLKLEEYDVPWANVMKRVTEHAVNTPNPYIIIPLIINCTDDDFENGIHRGVFPPLPWFAKQMFPWTHFGKHKGAWRFACCDSYGRRKELPFAEKKEANAEVGMIDKVMRDLIVPGEFDTR